MSGLDLDFMSLTRLEVGTIVMPALGALLVFLSGLSRRNRTPGMEGQRFE